MGQLASYRELLKTVIAIADDFDSNISDDDISDRLLAVFAEIRSALESESSHQTIWVVEEGSYSDYRVVGVFSTKENAEQVADAVGGSVDEWPLDPYVEDLNQGRNRYYVSILRDGSVLYVKRDTDFYRYEDNKLLFHGRSRHENSYLAGHVFATDEAHAVKIANEKRAELIADNKWPE